MVLYRTFIFAFLISIFGAMNFNIVAQAADKARSVSGETVELPKIYSDSQLYEIVDRIVKYTPMAGNPFTVGLTDPADPKTGNATSFLKIISYSLNPANRGFVGNIETERIILFNADYVAELLKIQPNVDGSPPWPSSPWQRMKSGTS